MKLPRLERVNIIDLGGILMKGLTCRHGQETHHGVRREEGQGDNLGGNIPRYGREKEVSKATQDYGMEKTP